MVSTAWLKEEKLLAEGKEFSYCEPAEQFTPEYGIPVSELAICTRRVQPKIQMMSISSSRLGYDRYGCRYAI